MRHVEPPNLQLGQIDIAKIVLDPRSRDDIPQILAGLQYIYCTPTLRQEVFDILKEVIPKNEKGQPVASDNGRPGMVLEYLNLAQDHLDRFKMLSQHGDVPQAIEKMAELAEILKNQIFRRCVDGETIPHAEKVFSVFQTHTEWVVKGKAGVPMELGVRVHVVEDRDQFILYHAVAQNQTDEKVAVQLLQETKSRFPELASLSLDKGYHSKAN